MTSPSSFVGREVRTVHELNVSGIAAESDFHNLSSGEGAQVMVNKLHVVVWFELEGGR